MQHKLLLRSFAHKFQSDSSMQMCASRHIMSQAIYILRRLLVGFVYVIEASMFAPLKGHLFLNFSAARFPQSSMTMFLRLGWINSLELSKHCLSTGSNCYFGLLIPFAHIWLSEVLLARSSSRIQWDRIRSSVFDLAVRHLGIHGSVLNTAVFSSTPPKTKRLVSVDLLVEA